MLSPFVLEALDSLADLNEHRRDFVSVEGVFGFVVCILVEQNLQIKRHGLAGFNHHAGGRKESRR